MSAELRWTIAVDTVTEALVRYELARQGSVTA